MVILHYFIIKCQLLFWAKKIISSFYIIRLRQIDNLTIIRWYRKIVFWLRDLSLYSWDTVPQHTCGARDTWLMATTVAPAPSAAMLQKKITSSISATCKCAPKSINNLLWSTSAVPGNIKIGDRAVLAYIHIPPPASDVIPRFSYDECSVN